MKRITLGAIAKSTEDDDLGWIPIYQTKSIARLIWLGRWNHLLLTICGKDEDSWLYRKFSRPIFCISNKMIRRAFKNARRKIAQNKPSIP